MTDPDVREVFESVDIRLFVSVQITSISCKYLTEMAFLRCVNPVAPDAGAMAAAHLRIDFRAFLPSAFGADSCGESKRFFFEKKNQKTFVHWASAFGWRGSQYPKVFCFFFSKKKVFLAGLNRSASRALGIMPGGFESDSREEGKQFFFEKNNEKTFVHGASAFGWRGSQYAKVFCLFFLKKKAFLPGLNRSVSSAAVT